MILAKTTMIQGVRPLAFVCYIIAASFSTTAFATNTWYVAKEDPLAANTLDEGRGSEALPFRTIQAALDNPAFEPHDIVLVKRGDYDEGEYCTGRPDTKAGSYLRTNRVYVAKTVHLKAVDGRDVTRIIGKWGSATPSTGKGGDGIRCMTVAAAALGTTIEGFTFENGASYQSSDGGAWASRNSNIGGGIFVNGQSKDVYVVDCAFRNCTGYLAPAIYGGTLIRCLVDKSLSYYDSSVLCGTYAFACVATRCSYSSSTARYALDSTSVAVNCTFLDNGCYSTVTNTAGAYNCIFAANKKQTYLPESKFDNSIVSTVSTNMAFATGFEDYRLPTDSPAIGAGSTAHRQVLIDLGVPAKYLEKDFSGATIDWSAESLNSGASQGTAVPTTTLIKFKGNTLVNGRLVYADQWIRSETFPEIFELRPGDDATTFFAFVRTTPSGGPKYPWPNKVFLETNGIARVIPSLRSSIAYQEYTPNYAAAEIWVDPTSAGSDEDGDGSEARPYHTIQHAIDSVSQSYTVIRAKRGDYKEGGAVRDGIMNRVNLYVKALQILLKSEEGPEVTTIWGAADPETVGNSTEPGCGTNAVRCVCGRAIYSTIQGFTLRDGHTLATDDPSSGDENIDSRSRDGAALATGDDSFWSVPPYAIDCIVTNCVSANSIARTTFSSRCKFVGNVAGGAVFNCGYQSANLVVSNACTGIFGRLPSNSGRSYMITAVGNTLVSWGSAFADWQQNDTICASVIVGGNVSLTAGTDVGNVVWGHDSVSKLKSTSINADPLLADMSAGDYRPAIGGPAVDFAAATDMPLFCVYLGSDYYGSPIRISSDGKLTSGCVQSSVLPYKVSVSASSGGAGLSVNGESGNMVAVLEDGATFSLSADTNCTRFAKGYTLNGVEHLFDSYPGSVALQVDGSPLEIGAIESTEWHVDAENGNDATGNGFSPGTAKRTFAEVFTNCAVTAGDTVYAHPGTYKDGEMRLSDTAAIASRVIVPENVTLKAVGSAAETVILGAWAPEERRQGNYGQGTNAVRCVALRANAVLDGFMVTGGRTLVGDVSYDSYGGGVFGVSGNKTALVRDCIISNNVAGLGGGGAYCRYLKCRILNNRTTYNGDGGAVYRGGTIKNCLVDGNYGTYVIMYPSSVYNCTIGRNNGNRSVYFYQPSSEDYSVFNSIVYRPGNNQSVYWNCALGNDCGTSVSEAVLLHGTFSTNVAAFKLDENYMPAVDSPVVDRGDDEKRATEFPETDLNGVPRVLNGGRFDIGAFEYDWRKSYSKDLGARVEVIDVTSNVVEAADAVRVPEGSLSLEWALASDSKPTFDAEVSGEGELAIVLDGEPFATLTAADGLRTFSVPALDASLKFDFNYSGDGYASLSGFCRNIGAVLIIK